MFKQSLIKPGMLEQRRSRHFYLSMDEPGTSNQSTEAEYV
jgi:hypothetical protein